MSYTLHSHCHEFQQPSFYLESSPSPPPHQQPILRQGFWSWGDRAVESINCCSSPGCCTPAPGDWMPSFLGFRFHCFLKDSKVSLDEPWDLERSWLSFWLPCHNTTGSSPPSDRQGPLRGEQQCQHSAEALTSVPGPASVLLGTPALLP